MSAQPQPDRVSSLPADSVFRLTPRSRLVLAAIAELNTKGNKFAPTSNVEISRAAGVRDQGQISKLLQRLEDRSLIHNTGGATAGIPNAWQLTEKGEELLHASRPPVKEETR